MDVSVANVENMTESDLRELIRQAQQSLDRRIAERARATLKEAKRMAAEVGFAVTFTKIGKPMVSREKPFAPSRQGGTEIPEPGKSGGDLGRPRAAAEVGAGGARAGPQPGGPRHPGGNRHSCLNIPGGGRAK